MERPTWATVIGILLIIFGIFGIMSGAQKIAMPAMLEMQAEFAKAFEETTGPKITIEGESEGESSTIDMGGMFKALGEQFKMPDWFKAWSPVIGSISIFIAALFLLAGIFLLMLKPFAVKLTYIALGLSIAWALFQIVIFSFTGSIMMMAMSSGAVMSAVIDLVLLIVVLTGSKEAFELINKEA